LLPVIIVYSQDCPLQTLKGRDVLMTKTELIADATREGILDNLTK